eukprot:15135554-Alexandrium_andersonii.AAC.1
MSASLVGSEMCIRDSPTGQGGVWRICPSGRTFRIHFSMQLPVWLRAVSYTHLTLPTICSV